MPKRASAKHILMACQRTFDGENNKAIAEKLGFTETTLSNWRKLALWEKFETELVAAYKIGATPCDAKIVECLEI